VVDGLSIGSKILYRPFNHLPQKQRKIVFEYSSLKGGEIEKKASWSFLLLKSIRKNV
jgi:hypothetical protein